jgi:hypothetical protein
LSNDELYAFWDAVRPERWVKRVEKGQRMIRGKMQNVSTIHPDRTVMAQGCRVLLLTGARLNEIFESDRRELSADGSVLAVPPDRFKSGSTHMIQLPVAAQEIIADPTQRWSSYDVASRNRILVPNEIREIEGYNPLPGGDKFPEVAAKVQPVPDAKPGGPA